MYNIPHLFTTKTNSCMSNREDINDNHDNQVENPKVLARIDNFANEIHKNALCFIYTYVWV